MIVTFYSYKGGVGRSMAMANVADILARRGLKLLIVDFDLEAPGLEQFFQINVENVQRNPGLLDLLLAYKQTMSVAPGEAGFRDLSRFICPIYERLPGGGRLDILAAGQRQEPEQLARYALSLRTFDWQDFYYNWEGELFFEWLRRSLAPERYDLVLVDSRTGVTEMGGICGYQLADVIVMLCAPNHQNLNGTANMVRDFRSAGVEALRRGRALDLIVVPARVEQRLEGEGSKLLDDFNRRFDESFSALLPERLRAAGLTFRDLTIPYDPNYAFDELVISDPARAAERRQIGAVFETLADTIALIAPPAAKVAQALHPTAQAPSGGTAVSAPARAAHSLSVPAGAASAATDDRASLRSLPETKYDPAKRFAGYDVFVDYSESDADAPDAIELIRVLEAHNLQVFFDPYDQLPGEDWRALASDALHHSQAVLFCVGAGTRSRWRDELLAQAEALRERGQIRALRAVLLPHAEPGEIAASLSTLGYLDLRGGISADSVERALREVTSLLGPQTATEVEDRAPYVGARPFEEKHVDLVFGRESTTEALLARMGEPLVFLTGPSGSGKTSLVRAGLLPRLRRGEGATVTSSTGAATASTWRIVTTEPGPSALQRLGDDLAGSTSESAKQPHAANNWWESRVDVDHALDAATGIGGRLLVVLDTFEQVLHAEDEGKWRACVETLLHCAQQRPGRMTLLIVLEADALPDLEAQWGALFAYAERGVALPDMSADDLRKAIGAAAERVGLAPEPGLVDRMVAAMSRGPRALPILQIVLRTLWEHRRNGWLTNAAYDALDGIRGVLRDRAEALYRQSPPAQQAAIRSIMLRLTSVDGSAGNNARRIRRDAVLPSSAGEEGGKKDEAYHAALDAMVSARLLVTSVESGHRMIEPAHEDLVRGWPRLNEWVGEERHFLEWRERWATAVAQWREKDEADSLLVRGLALSEAEMRTRDRRADLNRFEMELLTRSLAAREREGKDEQQQRRRIQRIKTTAMVVFAVLALGTGWGWHAADEQRRNAQAALQATEAERAALEQNLKEQREFADSQRRSADENLNLLKGALRDAQVVTQTAARAQHRELEKRQQAETAVQQLNSSLEAIKQRTESSSAASRQSGESVKAQEQLLKERKLAPIIR